MVLIMQFWSFHYAVAVKGGKRVTEAFHLSEDRDNINAFCETNDKYLGIV